MIKTLRHKLALAAVTLLLASPVQAQVLSDIFAADLLPGWRTESGSHMAAIRVQLSKGWKTYWRSPGDAGIPPEFDWRGSDNIRSVRVHWPAPEVFDFNGMHTIGYHGEMILPIEVWPEVEGAPVRLATSVDMGVCRDICVPASVQMTALLPPMGKADPAIRAALRAQPASGRSAGLRAHGCHVEPAGKGLSLQAVLDLPALGPDETVVIETRDPSIWVSEAEVRREGGRLIAESQLVAANRKPFALDRSGIVITVLAQGRAVEVTGCPAL